MFSFWCECRSSLLPLGCFIPLFILFFNNNIMRHSEQAEGWNNVQPKWDSHPVILINTTEWGKVHCALFYFACVEKYRPIQRGFFVKSQQMHCIFQRVLNGKTRTISEWVIASFSAYFPADQRIHPNPLIRQTHVFSVFCKWKHFRNVRRVISSVTLKDGGEKSITTFQ